MRKVFFWISVLALILAMAIYVVTPSFKTWLAIVLTAFYSWHLRKE